jgi:hypothetical protein
LLVAGQSHAGTVRYVDDDGLDGFNCTNAPYTTISAAIADAKPGDEIRVCPGTYVEQVSPFDMAIRGEAFGSRRAFIKPTAMTQTLPPSTMESRRRRPLDDGHLLDLDVDIDLSMNTVGACSPVWPGSTSERVGGRPPDLQRGRERTATATAAASSWSKAASGDHPRPADSVAFISKSVHFENFQKAGLVGIGPNTLVRLEDDALRDAQAPGAPAVPYVRNRQGRSRQDHQLDRDRHLSGGRQAAAGILGSSGSDRRDLLETTSHYHGRGRQRAREAQHVPPSFVGRDPLLGDRTS